MCKPRVITRHNLVIFLVLDKVMIVQHFSEPFSPNEHDKPIFATIQLVASLPQTKQHIHVQILFQIK